LSLIVAQLLHFKDPQDSLPCAKSLLVIGARGLVNQFVNNFCLIRWWVVISLLNPLVTVPPLVSTLELSYDHYLSYRLLLDHKPTVHEFNFNAKKMYIYIGPQVNAAGRQKA
jgi:hypothetical protein